MVISKLVLVLVLLLFKLRNEHISCEVYKNLSHNNDYLLWRNYLRNKTKIKLYESTTEETNNAIEVLEKTDLRALKLEPTKNYERRIIVGVPSRSKMLSMLESIQTIFASNPTQASLFDPQQNLPSDRRSPSSSAFQTTSRPESGFATTEAQQSVITDSASRLPMEPASPPDSGLTTTPTTESQDTSSSSSSSNKILELVENYIADLSLPSNSDSLRYGNSYISESKPFLTTQSLQMSTLDSESSPILILPPTSTSKSELPQALPPESGPTSIMESQSISPSDSKSISIIETQQTSFSDSATTSTMESLQGSSPDSSFTSTSGSLLTSSSDLGLTSTTALPPIWTSTSELQPPSSPDSGSTSTKEISSSSPPDSGLTSTIESQQTSPPGITSVFTTAIPPTTESLQSGTPDSDFTSTSGSLLTSSSDLGLTSTTTLPPIWTSTSELQPSSSPDAGSTSTIESQQTSPPGTTSVFTTTIPPTLTSTTKSLQSGTPDSEFTSTSDSLLPSSSDLELTSTTALPPNWASTSEPQQSSFFDSGPTSTIESLPPSSSSTSNPDLGETENKTFWNPFTILLVVLGGFVGLSIISVGAYHIGKINARDMNSYPPIDTEPQRIIPRVKRTVQKPTLYV